MNKFDLILLDADGTLFDFDRAEDFALGRTFAHYGFSYDAEVRDSYRTINRRLWQDFDQGKIGKPELLTARFRRLLDQYGLAADAAACNNYYLEQLAAGSQLLDGALEVCRRLAGSCFLAIATNGVSGTQKSRLAQSAIRPYIRQIIVSEDAGFAKPHAGFFEYALRLCGQREKSRTIIVGDNLDADIAGGADFGIATCWYNPAGRPNDRCVACDYVIRSLYELPGLIFPADAL